MFLPQPLLIVCQHFVCKVDSVNGNPLAFTVDGGVMVNDANVTTADVTSSNGVIHVIDKVLMPTATPNDIPRTAQCTGVHNTLVDAVIQGGLLETLQGEGPFTVFAPTDQAFSDAGIDLSTTSQSDLADILTYHVVSGAVPASAVTECMSADTVNGNPLSFTVNGGVMVNGANVTIADVNTSNGVIHVIDKVLLPTATPNDIPRTAQCTGVHNTLVDAVIQGGLLETLQGEGPFTVFAPTDQAFTDAGIDLSAVSQSDLADILTYHVVSGAVPASAVTECMSADTVNGNPLSFTVDSGVMVNDANVTIADVNTSNGIIHVIDKVLLPTATPNDIPRTAQCTGIHDTLVTAVIQGGLLETLQGEGPFTVFAPTDQAFTDAGIDLSTVSQSDLADILTYHVVSGAVPASAVTECMSADTVNGNPLSFAVNDGVMVNDANVTIPDVNTSNGIIHVIDKVLLPTTTPNDIPRTAQCTGIHNTLVTAVIQAGLLETLQGEGPFTVFAPTDQAFADAGINLSAVNQSQLSEILLYHVLAANVNSSAITDGLEQTMVNGDNVTFSTTSGVMINGANVTLADVVTSNGVIHVIDKVLMPPVDSTDDSESSADDSESSTDDDSSNLLWIIIGVILVLGGGAGAILFVRSRNSAVSASKDFSSQGLMNQLESIDQTAYVGQSSQTAVQQQTMNPAVQQPAVAQTVEVIPQPAVTEPVVLQQWTDDSGYTWRKMDDGSTMWWTGTEWQKYG